MKMAIRFLFVAVATAQSSPPAGTKLDIFTNTPLGPLFQKMANGTWFRPKLPVAHRNLQALADMNLENLMPTVEQYAETLQFANISPQSMLGQISIEQYRVMIDAGLLNDFVQAGAQMTELIMAEMDMGAIISGDSTDMSQIFQSIGKMMEEMMEMMVCLGVADEVPAEITALKNMDSLEDLAALATLDMSALENLSPDKFMDGMMAQDPCMDSIISQGKDLPVIQQMTSAFENGNDPMEAFQDSIALACANPDFLNLMIESGKCGCQMLPAMMEPIAKCFTGMFKPMADVMVKHLPKLSEVALVVYPLICPSLAPALGGKLTCDTIDDLQYIYQDVSMQFSTSATCDALMTESASITSINVECTTVEGRLLAEEGNRQLQGGSGVQLSMNGQPPKMVNKCVDNAQMAVKKVDPDAEVKDQTISEPVTVNVAQVVAGTATIPNTALAREKTGSIEVSTNWIEDANLQKLLRNDAGNGANIANAEDLGSGSSLIFPGVAISALVLLGYQ